MQQLIRIAAFALLALFASPLAAQTVAEGQDRADYLAWLARDPGARAEVLSFKSWLQAADVDDVVPTWQLLRTASMWRECNGARFEVAPPSEWPHLATTLTFVKQHVQPIVGEVQAMSGFRNETLNACAGGAKESAHRHFFALDLVPVQPISREGLMRSLCKIHDWRGERYDVGLGFYAGVRFHVDSKGFRRWGRDGSSATSPCNTGIFA